MFRLRSLAVGLALLLTAGLVAAAPIAGATNHHHHRHHRHPGHHHRHHRPHTVKLTVSTFNVLGYKHTARGGDKASWPDGVRRMHSAVRLIRHFHVDVVGFQELQSEQFDAFKSDTDGRWRLYPGAHFDNNYAMHNSLAWRRKQWAIVHRSYLRIPYFKGELVNMPVVLLRDRRTGRTVAFANFHNPADTMGPAQKWRNEGRHKEMRLARRMARRGIPLILTGDMNEQDKYFCAMRAHTPMKAANGGSYHGKGRCDPPDPDGIDWIFGSPQVRFPEFYKVPRDEMHRVSDHPFIAARVHIRRR